MDDLDRFFADLEKDIEQIARDEVPDKINEIYQKEAINSYSMYSPADEKASRYRRGDEGSFADSVNFRTEVDKIGDIIDINMYNDRITDCSCDYCSSENRYLDYYIEEGIAGTSSITRKPVIETTQEIVNEELGDVFGVSLKAKGYTIT